MKKSRISGSAYGAFHRLLGALCLLVSAVSMWTVVPLAIDRFGTSRLDAAFFALMIGVFAFLMMFGLDRVLSTVSLDSDGLTHRSALGGVCYDWTALGAAHTMSLKGALFYVIVDASGREKVVPCADSKVRAAIAEVRVDEAIRKKANQSPEPTAPSGRGSS